MTQNHSTHLLSTKALFPLLVQMSVPSIIGMLVGSLYNVVDTIFVGRAAGTLAIAGLSVAFPAQMIVMAVAQMIGVGSASIISRRLGEKRFDRAEMALGTALTSALLISLVLTFIMVSFSSEILYVFGASENTLPYG